MTSIQTELQKSWFNSWYRQQIFFPLHDVQTTSGVWQPSPPINAYWTALSLKINWSGQEADHLPPARTGVKMNGAIPTHPHMPLWHCTDNLTFTCVSFTLLFLHLSVTDDRKVIFLSHVITLRQCFTTDILFPYFSLQFHENC